MKLLERFILYAFIGVIVSYLFTLNINSYCIIFLFALSLIQFFKTRKIYWEVYFLLFIILFLLRLGSLLITENIDKGIVSIERSFSLLVFPFIFSVNPMLFERKRFFRILNLSVLVSIIVVIGLQIKFFINNEIPINWWLDWKYNHHFISSHIDIAANYYSFVLIVNIFYLILNRKTNKYWLLLIIPQCLMMVLLSSRALILYFSLSLIIFFSVVAYSKYKVKGVFITLLSACIIFFLLGEAVPVYKQRFTKTIQEFREKNHDEIQVGGVNVRLYIFKSSYEIIKENPIFGVGIGDVRSSLLEKYKENGFGEGVSFKYDNHNQYMQSYLGTGIFGFIVTILLVFYPFYSNSFRRDDLSLFVLGAFGYVFMFESFLETHKGIVFFCLMMGVLYSKNYCKP